MNVPSLSARHRLQQLMLLLMAILIPSAFADQCLASQLCQCSTVFQFTTMTCTNLGTLSTIPMFSVDSVVYDTVIFGDDGGNSMVSTIQTGAFNGLLIKDLRIIRMSIASVQIDAFASLGSYLTSLTLSDNHISTLQIGVFNNLTGLTSLDLSRNSLSQLNADWFTGAETLISLDLSYNLLTALGGTPFGLLSNLVTLHVSSNLLANIDTTAFNGLNSLNFLNLSYNSLSDIQIGTFDSLISLNDLELIANNIQTINSQIFDTIGSTLITLSLSSNALANLNFLTSLSPRLQTLQLNNCSIQSIPDLTFQNLSGLTTLGLSYNSRLSQITVQTLNNLTALSLIDLSNTAVESVPCGTFDQQASLTSVILSGNGITDLAAVLTNGVGTFSCWPDWIQIIDLSFNNITSWPSSDKLNTTTLPSLSLDLSSNPFVCDCGDIFTSRTEISRIIAAKNTAQCASPQSFVGYPIVCYDARTLHCNVTNVCNYDVWDVQSCAEDTGNNYETTTFSQMSPLNGPIGGGIVITVNGTGLTNSAVKEIFIGSFRGVIDNGKSSLHQLFLDVPPGGEDGLPLTISLTFCDDTQVDTGFRFTYDSTPNITKTRISSIRPQSFLISGGLKMSVTGQNFNSSAAPVLILDYILSNGSVWSQRVAFTVDSTFTFMTCIVPELTAIDSANIQVNVSFQFDDKYLSDNSLKFYVPPTIIPLASVFEFDPISNTLITLDGSNLLLGCQESDYVVTIGDAICWFSVSQNTITISVPSAKPNTTMNSSCDPNLFELKIKIGFYTYTSLGCVMYQESTVSTSSAGLTTSASNALTSGTTVAMTTRAQAPAPAPAPAPKSGGSRKKKQKKKKRKRVIKKKTSKRRKNSYYRLIKYLPRQVLR